MDRRAFDSYSASFVQALAAFDEVAGIAALGSTTDPEIWDRWSDHDFAVVLRNGEPTRFLDDVSWMPETTRIVAAARHGDIYNVVVYDDGHKVEYLVCNKPAASSITVTKFRMLLDRSDIEKCIEDARSSTLAQQKAMADEVWNPVNLAIVIVTAAQRLQRGEVTSAMSLVAAAADIALHMLAAASPLPAAADPLDPRRRLEKLRPATAREIASILSSPPDRAIDGLLALVNGTLRHHAPSLDWPGFDKVLRASLR
jgi:hypothetical protein